MNLRLSQGKLPKLKRNRKKIQELWDSYKKYNVNVIGIPKKKEEREKGTQAVFEAIITENFPQINVRCQATGPGSSENTSMDKWQKTTLRQN